MHNLLGQLPAVIYEYQINSDKKGSFKFVSDSSQKILGVSAEDLISNPLAIISVVHPEDVSDFLSELNVSDQDRKHWTWIGRLIVNNEERWMEWNASCEYSLDGYSIQRGIIQDITDKRANDLESEFRYQSMVEHLPVGIIIHKGGNLVFANTYAYKAFGADETKDFSGSDIFQYMHPEFKAATIRRMNKVLEGKPVPLAEQKYLRIDGSDIDVEAMAYPITFNGDRCVQVVFRDISDRKQAEARIKKGETFFAQLFQNAPMAVVMLDEVGKVVQLNRGFEEMFGYKLNVLRGENLNDFIVPEELQNEGIDLNNLIATNRVISVETSRKRKDGQMVNVILYGLPVIQDNEIIGVYGVYVDITERKRVEEELKIRNSELDNFVYKVSHDLRAPLSSVLGLVNLAKLPGNTDNPMEYLNIIGEKVGHLDNFIGDVLSHSKNLKLEVSVSNVDLRQLIQDTFDDLNYLAGAKDVNLNLNIEGTEFFTDPWRISEIFRNLISNAIKYRRLEEGVVPEVFIKVRVDNLRADISFSDNGIGIGEQDLAKIFEMFYRATEQSDGSGIGLYIVKNAVDKLGGKISVASKSGHGTRFNIILPNRINSISKPVSRFVEEG